MPSFFNKIKAIKDLRDQAKTMQSALAQEKIEIEHKGIKIAMDGNMNIVSFAVSDDLVRVERKKDLEAAIQAAFEECMKKVQRVMAEKMKEMGGLEKFGL